MSKNNNYFYKTLAMSNDIIFRGAGGKSPEETCGQGRQKSQGNRVAGGQNSQRVTMV